MTVGRHREKWPYLSNGLTDLHEIWHYSNGLTDQCEIWHSDAHWPSETYWQLKFRTFKIQDGGCLDGRHVEKRKTVISQQWLDRSAQNLA